MYKLGALTLSNVASAPVAPAVEPEEPNGITSK